MISSSVDNRERYILSSTTDQHQNIEDLDAYANHKDDFIYIYNFCILHKESSDLAKKKIEIERVHRPMMAEEELHH
jgi:hypothetical protein